MAKEAVDIDRKPEHSACKYADFFKNFDAVNLAADLQFPSS
jgi:hypothetical protein